MTRAIFAVIAAATAAIACTPPANACISCDYVPEVLNSGAKTSHAQPRRERSYTQRHERRSKAAKKTAAKREQPVTEAAAIENPAPTKNAEVEHSTITTAGTAMSNQVKAAITPEPTGPEDENSTISTAAAAKPAAQAKPVEQATADHNVGCKKYFPSTGLTLSVPCE